MDREKVIRAVDSCFDYWLEQHRCLQPLELEAVRQLKADALVLLKEREAKPPIHVHEEYPEHDWETDEKGEVDDCAWGQGYCNGPMCKRCYYSFCINCEPNGWDKKPCIVDFFKCPDCGERIIKHTKFCDNCGKSVLWEGR